MRTRALPDLAEHAKTMTVSELGRFYRADHQVISRHLKRADLTAKTFERHIDMGDVSEIKRLLSTMHLAALARHFNMTPKQMSFRLKAMGVKAAKSNVPPPKKVDAQDRYANIAELATQMHAAELARHYGVTSSTISKTLRRRGITAITAPIIIQERNAEIGRQARANKFRTQHKAIPLTDHRPKTQADMAADHLRRLSSIWRCNDKGSPDPKGTFWRRGWAVLTDAELMARAQAKGWNPREWMEVA